MDLATTLQRLYDSGINVTITWLWDGGFDFALISCLEWYQAGRPIDYVKATASGEPITRTDRPDPWHVVESADRLAEGIHDAALRKYPDSEYARVYGRVN
jgi:hypothetical protein